MISFRKYSSLVTAPAFGVRRLAAAFTLALALAATYAAESTNTSPIVATNSPTDSATNAPTSAVASTLTNATSVSISTTNTAPAASTNLTTASTNVTAQVTAEPTAAKDVTGFDEFKIIAQRNIFDPNRRAAGRPGRLEDRPKPTRVDYLNLVGAMSYEKGRFAFFDGSSSDYRKSVKPGDSIAGYKVAAVAQDKVTLQNGDQKIEVPVGGQLKREDQGEWRLNTSPDSFASSGSSSNTANSSSPSTNSSSSIKSSDSKTDSSSDEQNEIVKRLMEARRQGK